MTPELSERLFGLRHAVVLRRSHNAPWGSCMAADNGPGGLNPNALYAISRHRYAPSHVHMRHGEGATMTHSYPGS